MLAEVGHVSLITPRASQQGSVLQEARMVGSERLFRGHSGLVRCHEALHSTVSAPPIGDASPTIAGVAGPCRACTWARMRGLAHEASMTRKTHTLMVVHAHPDDEASSTGGLLRFAAEQGHTTIVVTCTHGDLGEVKIPSLRLNPRQDPADRQRLALIDPLKSIGQAGNLRINILVTPLADDEHKEAFAYAKAPELATPVHSAYLDDYQDRRFIPPWRRLP